MTDSLKTAFKIGDAPYNIELSKIPYLSSFVSFQDRSGQNQAEYVHGPISLFEIALKGIESGYRQCFRSLPPELSQYHTLCETYDFLCVDVLGGQDLDAISRDLKACKTDYDHEGRRVIEIKGNKAAARDAAFKLLYLILQGEFKDEKKDANKVFNSVLFIVSHSGTFKWRTRTVVRAACEERFILTMKQIANLDKWEKGEAVKSREDEAGDATTEEEEYEFYDSDDWD